ncbi:MAG TPA: GNAT family N-acetyltransferase [Acidimicrobiia bacterium]
MNEIVDNTSEHRFETTREGHTAELVYHLTRDRIVLIHTGVPEELGGRGVGGELVQAAVERARNEHLTIVPLCPYARHWLETHPDALGDVAIDWDTHA